MRLVPTDLLDPRPAADAARHPIAGAVNIPFAELPQRMHELPSRDDLIRVAGPPDLVPQVVAWLTQGDRRAAPATDFAHESNTVADEIPCLWKPTAFLAETLPHFPPGTALDLACGTGRDAVYLAAHGWSVTAVDILPDALTRARALARRYLPQPTSTANSIPTPIRWLELDLEAAPPTFDRRFDLITIFRYLHRDLIPHVRTWLRPGGSVLFETFTTLHREHHGKPTRDTHVLAPGELQRLFAGWQIRHHSESWRGRPHTARLWITLGIQACHVQTMGAINVDSQVEKRVAVAREEAKSSEAN